MQTSEHINELAAALAKAQGQIQGAVKDSTNPAFKSRYADLASVWDACRVALSANGLAVVQGPALADRGVGVTTRLLHSSGQWAESTLILPMDKATAQGAGSAITYARRYSLAAMVGVAPDDDDDGNAASQQQQQQRSTPKPEPSSQPGTRPALHDSLRSLLQEFHWPDEHKREFSEKLLGWCGSSLGKCMDDPEHAAKMTQHIEAELALLGNMDRPEKLQTLFATIMEKPF
jgi:hypothetical protein